MFLTSSLVLKLNVCSHCLIWFFRPVRDHSHFQAQEFAVFRSISLILSNLCLKQYSHLRCCRQNNYPANPKNNTNIYHRCCSIFSFVQLDLIGGSLHQRTSNHLMKLNNEKYIFIFFLLIIYINDSN